MLSFTLSGKRILYRSTNTDNSNMYQNIQEFISHIYIHNFSCNKLKLVQISHLRYLTYAYNDLILTQELLLWQTYPYSDLILIQISRMLY